jgi:hypothetical protein
MWYLLITHVVSSLYPSGIFCLPLWYLLITPVVSSEDTTGVIRRYHRRKPEDTTEVTRRYNRGNQKIPLG